MSVAEHKGQATAEDVRVAVVTVSDTRTEETDEGGKLVRNLCREAGFSLAAHTIVRDEPVEVAAFMRKVVGDAQANVVLITGGTGIARRDTTVEALNTLFEKTLDGFGELFRMLSYQDIGPAAMLSRATAGTIGPVAVFLMPGSTKAVRLAMEKLILPELPHVVAQLGKPPPGASPAT